MSVIDAFNLTVVESIGKKGMREKRNVEKM